jgi:uncharacterized membrane protein (UPF0127 family)
MLALMRLLALALVFLLAVGCGGNGAADGDGEAAPTAVIATADGEIEIAVEVADTDSERARGLMGRTSLPEDAGMVFIYPQPTEGAFWMKNTLIPLSIAFYNGEGTIVSILDMAPCRRDPCPLYDPGVPFSGALEVNQGAFERLGVREGDRIELRGIEGSQAALKEPSSE